MKKLSKKNWIKFYVKTVSNTNKRPASIQKFAKKAGYKEKDFYAHFSSFEALEEEVFVWFFKQTINLLEEDAKYHEFDAKHKLMSFYFTYFEILAANRSFVHFVLKSCNQLKSNKKLKTFKKHFEHYIDSLDIKTPSFRIGQIESFLKKGTNKLAWGQFALILSFWMKDRSKSFEKTDVLIEKSLHTSFTIIDTAALESIIDLGKFIYQDAFKNRF
ncbi:MAG: TetR/AcrR family transcriptional regulator [Crocinitomix sp.]|nr:TetR/AcrR family transcriptional regulator [Crocinitomix sp.]